VAALVRLSYPAPILTETSSMAKKRPAYAEKRKYFHKDMYIGTIPCVLAELQAALSHIKNMTDLQLLDQPKVTQETLVNALFLWLAKKYREKGLPGVEAELREPFAQLAELVKEDMRQQERAGEKTLTVH
jgi:hypothetical protein